MPECLSILISRLDWESRDCPLSAEILAPTLAFYIEADFKSAIERCAAITRFGRIGYSDVIYSNNAERIEYFSNAINVARMLVNTPSTPGTLGGMFNTLPPSWALSCAWGGKNSTTDNISARQLLNIHRICQLASMSAEEISITRNIWMNHRPQKISNDNLIKILDQKIEPWSDGV